MAMFFSVGDELINFLQIGEVKQDPSGLTLTYITRGGRKIKVVYDSQAEYDAALIAIANAGGGGGGGGSSGTFTGTSTIAVGAIPANKSFVAADVQTMFSALLIKSIAPSVKLKLSCNSVLDAVEDKLSAVNMTATVTKGSKEISTIDFYVGSTLVHTTATKVGGIFTYTHNFSTPLSSDSTFKVIVTDAAGATGTDKVDVTFIGKSYYGTVVKNITAPTEAHIKALTSTKLKTTKALTWENIVCNDAKLCYAYPASLGALTSIVDGMKFPYLDSYDSTTVTVDDIEYKVYLLHTEMSVEAADKFTQVYS